MGKIRINGIGGFHSHGGTPSYHPFLIDGIFHEINQPFWDTSMYGNPHIQNVKIPAKVTCFLQNHPTVKVELVLNHTNKATQDVGRGPDHPICGPLVRNRKFGRRYSQRPIKGFVG